MISVLKRIRPIIVPAALRGPENGSLVSGTTIKYGSMAATDSSGYRENISRLDIWPNMCSRNGKDDAHVLFTSIPKLIIEMFGYRHLVLL